MKMHTIWLTAAALGIWLLAACSEREIPLAFNADAPPLIPQPGVVQAGHGQFVLRAETRVVTAADNEAERVVAEQLMEMLAETGVSLKPGTPGAAGAIVLALDAGQDIPAEGYVLEITDTGIQITAGDHAGLLYGASSVWQLLARVDTLPVALPALRIMDAPRFAWRGSHHDVVRHIFPMEHLKRHLDLMARYKFNVFHWHLTDDQGWRLEIKGYPKLTEIGAWRARTALHQRDGTIQYDDTRYGGFYTQDEAREIVEYARARNITVVPEFEMPGHAVAILSAYPEFACTPGPFEPWVDWGVNENVLCPSEATFTFVENVLDELMEIFPSEYIHVGGDEAPTIRWQQSALAQSIIRREGLKDEYALQGWFMRRVEAYLNQHGRRMLAWDEMLDGNPAQSTTIMAWRGIGEGIKAAKRGHDVVMTPVSYSYFDYCQSRAVDEPYCPMYLPLQQVYAFDPVPPELSADEARHILGGQANLWVEHIRTAEHAEYMLWPRLLAMSEVLWSTPERRDWEGFMARIPAHLAALGRLGVNYRVPEVLGLDGDVLSREPETTVILHSPLDDAAIIYTLDGSDPVAASPRYQDGLTLQLGADPVVVSARLLTKDGRLGPIMRARYYATTSLQPARAAGASAAGVRRDYFELGVLHTDELLGAQPMRSDVSDVIGLADFSRQERFGLRYRGVLNVPSDGVYRFALASDDGARLLIDDELLIDRDGPQSPGVSYGSVGLERGAHAFELRYFQGGGDRVLELKVSVDGGAPMAIPGEWFGH